MQLEKGTFKKLYNTALYTSPLLGVYSIIYPFILFRVSGQMPKMTRIPFEVQNEFLQALIPAFFVATVSFVIWLINIELFRFQSNNSSKLSDGQRYGLSFVLVFILITIITTLSEQIKEVEYNFLRLIPFVASTANNSIILILINLVVNRDKRIRLELEKSQFEVAALTARQEQLRHQIHPHMLFNTLSTLKVLIKKQPDLAENYLVKLASFLRKSLDTDGQYLAQVHEEVELAKDFLDLQRLRFEDAIFGDFKLSEEHLTNGKLPLFSLQILIENAVKHNAQSKVNPLRIQVESKGEQVVVTNNLIRTFEKKQKEGVGLRNLSERYRLFGVEEPNVMLDKESSQFVVKITVLK